MGVEWARNMLHVDHMLMYLSPYDTLMNLYVGVWSYLKPIKMSSIMSWFFIRNRNILFTGHKDYDLIVHIFITLVNKISVNLGLSTF